MVVPRYLVTGATGFLGAEVVKQLIGRGQQVAALVRSPDKADVLKSLGVAVFAGDITDPDTLREPMNGVDGVFHTAAWYRIGARKPGDIAERVNVDGTRNVIAVARDLGVPRIVYTSTVAVLGDTRGRVVNETYFAHGPFLGEYDRSKWKAHYDVVAPAIKEGAPIVIVMPGLIYGPGDTSLVRDTLVQLLRGRLFVTPSRTTFAWGYIEDVARGLRLAMDDGTIGESYLLTGPIHTFREAMDMAARIANKRRPRIHPTPALMKMAAGVARLAERWDFQFEVPAETLRLMAGTTWIGSSAKAQRALGFSARSLNDGLRHTIEHELRQLGMA